MLKNAQKSEPPPGEGAVRRFLGRGGERGRVRENEYEDGRLENHLRDVPHL